MDKKNTINENISENAISFVEKIPSATPLSPLDLNKIKLDDKHTVLTPQYLDNLINERNKDLI